MKFYLSSQNLGNEVEKLKKLIPKNNKTAYISNALDFSIDLKRREESEKEDIKQLTHIGLDVELMDLRHYFNQRNALKRKIKQFGVIWVRGGNCFVLRQAMRLSGFDNILRSLVGVDDVLYGGYSAGICVLSSSLKGLELVDDAKQNPYNQPVIWDGLGIFDYSIVPHYKSDHPESEGMNKVIEYYIKNKILFIALKDGEVIIFD